MQFRAAPVRLDCVETAASEGVMAAEEGVAVYSAPLVPIRGGRGLSGTWRRPRRGRDRRRSEDRGVVVPRPRRFSPGRPDRCSRSRPGRRHGGAHGSTAPPSPATSPAPLWTRSGFWGMHGRERAFPTSAARRCDGKRRESHDPDAAGRRPAPRSGCGRPSEGLSGASSACGMPCTIHGML